MYLLSRCISRSFKIVYGLFINQTLNLFDICLTKLRLGCEYKSLVWTDK